MRAVWIGVPEEFLEERHRLGHDKKFPFYARVGVGEIWLVEPSNRATEVYELVGGAYRLVPFVDGVARSPVLGIELQVAGDQLELRDGDERAVI